MAKWYDEASLVKGLGNALVEAEVLESAADYNDFMRKPNQYNAHYEAWEANGFPESEDDDGWEEFVNSFESEESDDDDNDDGSDETS